MPPLRRLPLAANDHRALETQLQIAELALVLGDPVLLDMAAAAAQRLPVALYGEAGSRGGRARDLGLHVDELRAALSVGRFS